MCQICLKGGAFAAPEANARPFAPLDINASAAAASIAANYFDGGAWSKLTTGRAIANGDANPALPDVSIIGTDEAGDGKGVAPGNPVITVGDPSRIGTINDNGDQDYFRVTLEAGKTYEIGMYSYMGGDGPSGPLFLPDAYVELYKSNGTTQVVEADGGATTPYNDANSGFDVLITFDAEESGVYYINARGYDNDPTDGTTGEGIGDYELFVREVDPNDPNVYRPYYDPQEDPLYALDWGTQVNKVNQSARNPDGDEGIRPTGNKPGTPDYGAGFAYDSNEDGTNETYNINGLANAQGKDIEGKNVITIYFAKVGDVFVSEKPTEPGLPPGTITAVAIKDYEFEAVFDALGEFEKAADIVYLEVDDRNDADFIYTSYQGTPGPGVSLLGSMSPPDESDEGLAQFNSGDERWNERDLEQGGFSFVTLIHEFGHGHGMAHPHDNGGRSGIMRGVEEESPFDYTTGDFELNQGVHTMMSYEDGWQSSPYGNAPTDVGYGYLGGLMAFDIATIQDKYGVNEEWATGDDKYRLKDVNAPGTYFYSIWDAGGTDEMIYKGDKDSSLDLRDASLAYQTGGGGYVSYADGIFGGFTIANRVTIENATSGEGDDTLQGNKADNKLAGNGGDDRLKGNGGEDVMDGGDGKDTFNGAKGDDAVRGGLGADYVLGGDGGDRLSGDAGKDVIYGGEGADILIFAEGDTGATRGSADRLMDFSQDDGDRINLAAIDADSDQAGVQGFSFIGSDAFSGAAGELRYNMDSVKGRTFIEGDVDGDGTADFVIKLDSAIDLLRADFVI